MNNKTLAMTIAAVLIGGVAYAAYQQANPPGPQFAQVTQVEPVTRTETFKTPREVCEDRIVQQRLPERDGNIGGTVAGAVIGGLVGNQIGGGNGKKLATVGGAVAGGFAGREIDRRHVGGQVTSNTVRECRTVTDTSSKQSVIGYDVTYQYKGEVRTIRMDRDPGPSLPVVDGAVMTQAGAAVPANG